MPRDVGGTSGANAGELEARRVAAGHVGNRAEIDVRPFARGSSATGAATRTYVSRAGRSAIVAHDALGERDDARFAAALILSGVSLAR